MFFCVLRVFKSCRQAERVVDIEEMNHHLRKVASTLTEKTMLTKKSFNKIDNIKTNYNQ